MNSTNISEQLKFTVTALQSIKMLVLKWTGVFIAQVPFGELCTCRRLVATCEFYRIVVKKFELVGKLGLSFELWQPYITLLSL